MQIFINKRCKKYLQKQPKRIRENFVERIELFSRKPFDRVLANHPLKGSWDGFRSINITGDILAIYRQDQDLAFFVDIGTHHELYRN